MKNTNITKQPTELVTIFQALSDPIRLDIVACLLEINERRIKTTDYSISKSTLSHHIKILKEIGLLKVRKEGVTHIYSLDKETFTNNYPGILDLIALKMPSHELAPFCKNSIKTH